MWMWFPHPDVPIAYGFSREADSEGGQRQDRKLGPRKAKSKLQEEQRPEGKWVDFRKLLRRRAWNKMNSWMVRKHRQRALLQSGSL